VLSDVIMPGMGGRELARELGVWWPKLTILFMSGYNDDGEFVATSGDLGSSVLAKPFTSETLARHVREALDRRQASETSRGAHIA
jgi:two-component system, cell cycle sensor histidine kinase and response regulator CckA